MTTTGTTLSKPGRAAASVSASIDTYDRARISVDVIDAGSCHQLIIGTAVDGLGLALRLGLVDAQQLLAQLEWAVDVMAAQEKARVTA